MTCARSANLGGLTALIADGADVNARETSRGQTALMWAVAHRQSEIVAALLEAGASVYATTASEPRRSFVGNRMIVFDVPEHPGIQTIPYGGFTPLLFAAQQGDLESARLLLEAGADVNDTSAAGVSALTMAAHSGHGSLGSFLLAHGADPNAAGAGYTDLHAAVLAGDLGLVEALLAHNADPNAVLTNGTPVRKHSQDLAFNIDWRGATPFWLAAQFAELDMMRALATAGADPRATAMGDTAACGRDAGVIAPHSAPRRSWREHQRAEQPGENTSWRHARQGGRGRRGTTQRPQTDRGEGSQREPGGGSAPVARGDRMSGWARGSRGR